MPDTITRNWSKPGWRGLNAGSMGLDAQTHHPQQVLQLLQGLQHRNAELPARRRAQELAHLLRRGHRQLPDHRSKEVPDYRVSRVYREEIVLEGHRRPPSFTTTERHSLIAVPQSAMAG